VPPRRTSTSSRSAGSVEESARLAAHHLQGAVSGNLVLNLDSYANRDPRNNGESADGLAIKEGSGTGNVVRGARLWHNVDDGFDTEDSTSTLTSNLAVGNGTAVRLGSSTSSGNSWDLGGTWNDSSLVSTNPAVITGPRAASGGIPHSDFLVPRNGADVGARS
jgi:hypothetical protein